MPATLLLGLDTVTLMDFALNSLKLALALGVSDAGNNQPTWAFVFKFQGW